MKMTVDGNFSMETSKQDENLNSRWQFSKKINIWNGNYQK